MSIINLTLGILIALAGLIFTIRAFIKYFQGQAPLKSLGILFFTVNMIHLGLIFIFGFN